MIRPAFLATFLGMVPLTEAQQATAQTANILGPLAALIITMFFKIRCFNFAFAMQNKALEARAGPAGRACQDNAARRSRTAAFHSVPVVCNFFAKAKTHCNR